MKRRCWRWLGPIFACAFLPGVASGAESEKHSVPHERVSVSASALTPFFGAYELEARARASGAFAILVNTSYLRLEHGDWTTNTATVGAGLTYFFERKALRGWYAEAIGELMFSSWRYDPSHRTASLVLGYSGIAAVGYQIVWDAGPVLDLAGGVVALHFPGARVSNDGASRSFDAFTNVYPAAKVNVGWAF